jgi:lipopolysaccharide export system protein LptC
MSDLARRERERRRAWAAAGSSHDRLIAALRIVLPMGVGVLGALLAFAPLTLGRDLSFILSKDRVEVATERMRLAHATYTGTDGKGQPFRLDAASAVQASSRDPIVRLQSLNGKIQLADGPATVKAPAGRYDIDTQHVAFDGPVRFDEAGGYTINTSNVLLDMTSKQLASRGAATGTLPFGTFSADKLRANLDTRVVTLEGRAHLLIRPSHGRARR